MDQRPLGNSGMSLSGIGFGAFKIGRNQGIKYPADFDLPSDAEAEHLLNGVLDLGINYIDTAPAYGYSEERIGRAIAHRREEFILSTKVGETFENNRSQYAFSKAATVNSVEQSLRRLRADVLDIVFVHSNGDDEFILRETDVVATLMELRAKGTIRAIGFSGKTPSGADASLTWADALMVTYHRDDTSHADVISLAAAAGVGVIVKKGLASGHLPADEALQFVRGNTAVTSMVVGSLSLQHLASNIALFQ